MCFRTELVFRAAGLGLLFPLSTVAVEGLVVDLGEVSGSGWRAQDVRAEFRLSESGTTGMALRLGRLDLPGLDASVQEADLRCAAIEVSETEIRCPSGELELQEPSLFFADAAWAVSIEPMTQSGRAEVKGSIRDTGEIDANLIWDRHLWRGRLEGRDLSLETFTRLLRQLSPDFTWQLSGQGTIAVNANGDHEEGPGEVGVQLVVTNLDFTERTGRYLGENLSARAEATLGRMDEGRWRGTFSVELAQGGLLTPYLFLDAAEPLKIQAELNLRPASGTIDLAQIRLSQDPLLSITGDAGLTLQPLGLEHVRLRTRRTDVEGIYRRYFQPVLTETLLEDVRWDGALTISADWRRGRASRISAELSEVGIEDRYGERVGGRKRFGLQGLDGRLIWTSDSAPEPTVLAWSGGHLMEKFSFGPSLATLAVHEGTLALSEPLELHVLDGSLLVDRLELGRDPGRPDRLDFDGVLTPISMEGLSVALGWPALSGTLSGVIPGLSYEKGALGIDGTLLVRLFDGRILIRDLELTDLFGALPTLTTNLEVKDLDLEMLTRTFAFGRITGRLEGEIKGLRLESWRPVTFDARFRTPEGDESPHRISQEAVEHISTLGGGVSAAVSKGFLGIFKEFNYGRLGVSCRLQGGVCEMGGVEPASQGYYLVIGSGIPQINVIGFNRRIDWDQLLERLVRAVETGPAVVQ